MLSGDFFGNKHLSTIPFSAATYRCRTSRADPPRSSCGKISTDKKVYRLLQSRPKMKGKDPQGRKKCACMCLRARACAKVSVCLWSSLANEQNKKNNDSIDINPTNLKAREVSCDNCFAIRCKMLQIATQVPVRRQDILLRTAHTRTVIIYV